MAKAKEQFIARCVARRGRKVGRIGKGQFKGALHLNTPSGAEPMWEHLETLLKIEKAGGKISIIKK